jgi:Fe-S-cluster-containing hydrogenase component 2
MFMVTINSEVCTGCGQCAESCPAQIITMVDSRAQVSGDVSECLGCQSCTIVCSVGGVAIDEF